jgi:hypothetical protein
MPYEVNPLKRILIQLFFTSIVGLLIIIVLTELANLIAKDTPVPASFYQYDIFIFLIWFFVLNGILYRAALLLCNEAYREKLRIEDKKIRSEGFSIKDGRQKSYRAIRKY